MSQNTIHLQCKSCGGNLDIDRNQSLIFCPFCGSRELLIDSDVLREEYFGCHPCKNTSSLKIKTSDLTGTVIPALGHEPSIVTL